MTTHAPNPDALKQISLARTGLNAKMPYLRSMTNGLVPVEVPGLGTVGVSAALHFLYDPGFLLRIKDPLEVCGVYFHEVLHPMKRHRERRLAFGLLDLDKGGDPRLLHLWNMACDMENNRDTEAAGFKLPGKPTIPFDPCYTRNFKTRDGKVFPDNLLAEDYYALLKDLDEQGGGNGQGGTGQGAPGAPSQGAGGSPGKGPAGDSDASDDAGAGEGSPEGARVGAGRCGGACGAKLPGEPEGTAAAGRTAAEVDSIRAETARAIRDHIAQKGVGSVPLGIARWAEKADEALPVPWWVLLTRACQRAVSWAQGQVAYKYDRVSRRQAGIGFGPGRAVLPALRRPVPNVWVGVDTSASMGQKDVSVVLKVVEDVMRVTQKEITFFACDTKVHEQKQVKSWRDAVKLIVGGGGTDFRPVFEAAKKARPEQRPQVLVFVTDGQGPAPEVEPQGFKTVWLLVGKYATRPCEWGDQIMLNEVEAPPA